MRRNSTSNLVDITCAMLNLRFHACFWVPSVSRRYRRWSISHGYRTRPSTRLCVLKWNHWGDSRICVVMFTLWSYARPTCFEGLWTCEDIKYCCSDNYDRSSKKRTTMGLSWTLGKRYRRNYIACTYRVDHIIHQFILSTPKTLVKW